ILLAYPNVCPYPNCDEKLDLIEFPRRDSESSGISSIAGNLEKNLGISSLDMVDEIMEEDDEEDDSALQSTDPNSNTERAGKIYNLFVSIGKEKTRGIKTFSASTISNLSQDNIDYVIVKILARKALFLSVNDSLLRQDTAP
ncbi:10846_t:CDS:2, partial [Entrophospora sp. SA101]